MHSDSNLTGQIIALKPEASLKFTRNSELEP